MADGDRRADASGGLQFPVPSRAAPSNTPNVKRVHIKTYGCQMNVYDSERLGEALAADGFEPTDDVAEADLVILNTCHIREKAAEKVYSELGRVRATKQEREKQGRDTVVAVAGCVAQAEGAEMVRRAPVVDLVVGPQSYHLMPELVARTREQGSALVEIDLLGEDKFESLPVRQTGNAPRRAPAAFLTVQEGCDKFCTFCVVPYTRGAELSRPVGRLVEEAQQLVAQGVREITLLGQNVNAYHGDDGSGRSMSLAGLIRRMAKVDGLDRIRYTTSHPRDMTDELIAAHADVPKLMPYLHLPFQAGADRVLAGMNRKHAADDYVQLVRRIRAARPDIALSTDIIVGFPGETEAEFQCTLDLVREVGFAQAYSFKYSPRPGTPAANIDDQVSEDEKADRLQRLQSLLEEQQSSFNGSLIGRTLPVLFDRPGRRSGQILGRSPYLQVVHAEGEQELLGRIIPVEIVSAGQNSLSGAIPAA
ncbi:MAG: tRNA (N6-isopentenyl adenosine(37)-C2)-methylthiotransferase MiaB [Hyphomicrobiaceae bacterium]